nr:hypothetical protein BaRGS_023548 [Batillaria attramentaria]
MSMKFERGLDAEVVKFIFLSDDYSKLLFLQDDRYIEFHTQFGRHHRTRIPKFGRDLSYHQTSCDAYFVGVRVGSVPEITSLKFRDGLTMGLGTSTGHVLLYDIRSNKPFLTKDHMYDLPIRDITFHEPLDLVLSMDSKIVKLWDRNSSLGTAPKWCAFLDNLTEELEESSTQTVYDDYKFITRKELEELGLSHLIGSNLLRSYMHGFFVDIRLYRKKLPSVNRAMAERLLQEEEEMEAGEMHKKKKIKKAGVNPLKDDRFKLMFENPDFQIDTMSEEYRLLNPVMARLEQSKQKDKEKVIEKFEQIQSYTEKAKAQELRDHKAERRKLGRSANVITREIKAKPKFWMGKRVQ